VREYGLERWHKRNIPQQIPLDAFELDDNALMGIVHADVIRTGRTIFFLPARPIPMDDESYGADHMYQWGQHCRRLERILYVFARLNRGLGYMQGFNQLIVPFYYILQATQFRSGRGTGPPVPPSGCEKCPSKLGELSHP
jgi:hypothetical protein